MWEILHSLQPYFIRSSLIKLIHLVEIMIHKKRKNMIILHFKVGKPKELKHENEFCYFLCRSEIF